MRYSILTKTKYHLFLEGMARKEEKKLQRPNYRYPIVFF
jgi:hypothetical protein